MNAYTLDLDNLTVFRTDDNGEQHDPNADGAPCETVEDLRAFVVELHEQGFYAVAVRDDLLGKLPTVDLLVYGEGSDDMRITMRPHPDGWRWMDADGNDAEISGATAVQALGAAIAAWGSSGLHGVTEAFEAIAAWGRA